MTAAASFNRTNGWAPNPGLIADSSGNLYGTTNLGGNGYGTIFKFSPTSRELTVLAAFDDTDSVCPLAGLVIDAEGNLFGTTSGISSNGFHDWGAVFELPVGSHSILTLHTFDDVTGGFPSGPLTIDALGNLYGTTQVGGSEGGGGTIYELISVPEPQSLDLMITFLFSAAVIGRRYFKV